MVIAIMRLACVLTLSGIALVAGAPTEESSNVCTPSLKNHLLTCEHVDWRPHADDGVHPIEAQLSNETFVLIVKNSGQLELRPELHTDAFSVLNSYQVVNVRELRIAPATFANLSRLEYVKICDNGYARIVADTFQGLAHLKTLNLNNNSLHDVECGAFNGLGALETLELTHNDFSVVRAQSFVDLARLKSLFLYHNNIAVLEDGCLDGLERLNVLDLTYNRIARISAAMFNGLSISQLYLSYNHIEVIEGDFALANLEFLYLQNNRLKSVSATLFSALPALQDIDISRNRITDISPLAFYNCTKLMNLNYKENNLQAHVDFEFASNATSPFITA